MFDENILEMQPRFKSTARSAYPITAWLGEALRQILLFPTLRLFVQLQVEGLDNLTCAGPYIFAANHASHLDTPCLLKALSLRLRLQVQVAAAADYFFTWRWKGVLVGLLLNAFPFERRGPDRATALAQAEKVLSQGYSLLIFPEGTRSQDGQLQPFKWGVGKLAQAEAVKVVPTRIEGTFAALPRGSHWPHRHAVIIRFGSPLSFTPDSDPLHIAATIEQHVRALGKESTAMSSKSYTGIYAIKPWWQKRLATVEALLIKWRIHPNLITLSGVACAGLMGITLAASASWPWLVLAVAPLAIGRLAANALDGLVARRLGLATPWGEVYNECCDRLSDILVFAGLVFNGHIFASLAWGVLVLILFNSYLGTVAKASGGKRQFGGLLAKADRMIYIAIFSLVALFLGSTAWNWLLLAFIPAILLTIVQRTRWIYAELKQA